MAELDGPRWGPASKAAPKQLVVLCHGLGADGHDLIDLAPSWAHALPDALFVSVDAPFQHDSGFRPAVVERRRSFAPLWKPEFDAPPRSWTRSSIRAEAPQSARRRPMP